MRGLAWHGRPYERRNTLTFSYNDFNNREVKHDVNGRRQTAKITSNFELFLSNP